MDFKDGLKVMLTLLSLVSLLAMACVAVDSKINSGKDAYIIVKLLNGNIIEGYGEYKNTYKQAYICVDGTWYRTSYQNVVIMTKSNCRKCNSFNERSM